LAHQVREVGLMTKKEMLFGTMDIIYTKVKPPNLRKLEYKHWLEALLLIARQVSARCISASPPHELRRAQ
jgi:hypothetical protein